MMKIRIVEIQPPPNFQAAAPASMLRNGPSIFFLPGFVGSCVRSLTLLIPYALIAAFCI